MAELRRNPSVSFPRPARLDAALTAENWLTEAEVAAATEKALAHNDYMTRAGQGRDPELVVAQEIEIRVFMANLKADVDWQIAFREATGAEWERPWPKKKPPKK